PLASRPPRSFPTRRSSDLSDIKFNGFAIECRLNAEDPYNHFQPSSGYIDRLFLPNGGMGLRVETTLYSNYTLPPFYDSMVEAYRDRKSTRLNSSHVSISYA